MVQLIQSTTIKGSSTENGALTQRFIDMTTQLAKGGVETTTCIQSLILTGFLGYTIYGIWIKFKKSGCGCDILPKKTIENPAQLLFDEIRQ
ncbi:MAG: hypothetical protein GY857_00860 [Desulfobacula sp.]|nr:hypothetical protein [Desulfobacula sp.]